MPTSARAPPVQTRAAAHAERPRSSPSHNRKKLRTSACASRKGDIHMTKQHCKRPRGRRGLLVAGSKNTAPSAARPNRHFEVDRVLRTCAHAWQNGHGCILGKQADEPGMLGLATNADLKSWWLCVAVECNLAARTQSWQSLSPS